MGTMMRRIYLGEKKRGVEKDGRPPRIFRISPAATRRRNGNRREEGKRVNIVESCSRPLTDGVASITYFKIFRREFEHSS